MIDLFDYLVFPRLLISPICYQSAQIKLSSEPEVSSRYEAPVGWLVRPLVRNAFALRPARSGLRPSIFKRDGEQ